MKAKWLLSVVAAVSGLVIAVGAGGTAAAARSRSDTAPASPTTTTTAATAPVVTPSATPTLAATPVTGLHERSYVRLNGTGFAPDASVGTVRECLTGGACDQSFGYPVTADGTGEVVDAWTVVHREITVGAGTVVCDATPGACSVQVGSFEFPITFSLPRELVTVSPTSGLLDGGLVTVTASNFEPGRWILTTQCATPDGDPAHCWNTRAVTYAQTDAGGGVVRSGTVVRLLPTPDGTVDCAAQTCYLAGEDVIDYEHRWITAIQLVVPPTTTTSAPPTTTTMAGVTGAASLPKTGGTSGPLAAGGALALMVGSALVATARRRTRLR